jgi:MoaA/NifB/PqqE/SkfB family radical SAM enzyme
MCYRGRVPRIHICATGEPFLHPDILEIVDYAIEVYGTTSIQTDFFRPIFEKNNYLAEIIKRQDYISYITTDILSGDPKVHERLKKGSCYEDVLSSMEYINKHSDIHFEVHYIITKHNYKDIDKLIDDLSRRRINCHISIVNLHPHGFNDFTSTFSLYTSKDVHITTALEKAKMLGRKRGIPVSIPLPADAGPGICGSFWTRFQTWPVKGIDRGRYGENVIVGGCNAVVIGKLKSLGYIFDYINIMDLWNNEHFVRIRENLLRGIYPDEACQSCQNYNQKNQRGLRT